MADYYFLTIEMPVGGEMVKRYFSLDHGWTASRDKACAFPTYAEAEDVAFDEGLDDNEFVIEPVVEKGEQ